MISRHHQELKYFESSVVTDHNDNSSSRDTGSTTKKARGLAAAPCLLPEGVERALCMGRAWSLYDFMRGNCAGHEALLGSAMLMVRCTRGRSCYEYGKRASGGVCATRLVVCDPSCRV